MTSKGCHQSILSLHYQFPLSSHFLIRACKGILQEPVTQMIHSIVVANERLRWRQNLVRKNRENEFCFHRRPMSIDFIATTSNPRSGMQTSKATIQSIQCLYLIINGYCFRKHCSPTGILAASLFTCRNSTFIATVCVLPLTVQISPLC